MSVCWLCLMGQDLVLIFTIFMIYYSGKNEVWKKYTAAHSLHNFYYEDHKQIPSLIISHLIKFKTHRNFPVIEERFLSLSIYEVNPLWTDDDLYTDFS